MSSRAVGGGLKRGDGVRAKRCHSPGLFLYLVASQQPEEEIADRPRSVRASSPHFLESRGRRPKRLPVQPKCSGHLVLPFPLPSASSCSSSKHCCSDITDSEVTQSSDQLLSTPERGSGELSTTWGSPRTGRESEVAFSESAEKVKTHVGQA